MSDPRTGPRHEPERIHERAADPAEAADRSLEPKAPHRELAEADEAEAVTEGPLAEPGRDPHHVLNRPVDRADPTADSDPYGEQTEEDEQDRASGTRGSGRGAER